MKIRFNWTGRESTVAPQQGTPQMENDVSEPGEDKLGAMRERQHSNTMFGREGARIEAKLRKTHEEMLRSIQDFDRKST